MKELTLELGRNDPTIVWPDTNIERAATQIVGGACANAGRVCNSVERVLVYERVEDVLIDAMVDDDQFETVVDLFERTVEKGVTVEYGGRYGGDLGYRVFEPTVLSGVTPDMPTAKEEMFGPLIPVISVADFDEALTEANNTEYGLEAGRFTQDIDHAKRAADAIDASGVNINTVSGFRADHMPYGGFKDSGVGKEGIKYAVRHFSRENSSVSIGVSATTNRFSLTFVWTGRWGTPSSGRQPSKSIPPRRCGGIRSTRWNGFSGAW